MCGSAAGRRRPGTAPCGRPGGHVRAGDGEPIRRPGPGDGGGRRL